MPDYNVRENIGTARYVVNYHDGFTMHPDGSPFYGIRIANNQRDLRAIVADFKLKGYVER